MSGFVAGPLAQTGPLGAAVSNLLFGPRRSIGTMIPEVVVEEIHHDELVVTEHPVERGTQVSDHAYMRPVELQIRCAWSSALSISGAADALFGSGGTTGAASPFSLSTWTEGYPAKVYEAFRKVQTDATPIDVYTGKRVYHDMIVCSLAVTTDAAREYVLDVSVGLRQVIIVETRTATMPPKHDQKSPDKTDAPADQGQQQPQDKTSLLKQASESSGPLSSVVSGVKWFGNLVLGLP